MPGDLSVIGFDDTKLAPMMDTSSVRQSVAEMAALALDRLIPAIKAQTGSTHTRRLISGTRRA